MIFSLKANRVDLSGLSTNSICPNFRKIRIPARVWSQGSRIGDHIPVIDMYRPKLIFTIFFVFNFGESQTTDENSRVPTLFALSCGCSGLPPAFHAYLVVPAAVPSQARSPLETLPTARTTKGGGTLLVDLLVVAEESGQPEGFAARVADVLFPLRVDAHVVAQGHVVCVWLVAEVTTEVAGLVGVLVVQQGAGMLVGAAAQVTGVGPLVRVKVHTSALQAEVGAVDGGGGGRQVLGRAVVGR